MSSLRALLSLLLVGTLTGAVACNTAPARERVQKDVESTLRESGCHYSGDPFTTTDYGLLVLSVAEPVEAQDSGDYVTLTERGIDFHVANRDIKISSSPHHDGTLQIGKQEDGKYTVRLSLHGFHKRGDEVRRVTLDNLGDNLLQENVADGNLTCTIRSMLNNARAYVGSSEYYADVREAQ